MDVTQPRVAQTAEIQYADQPAVGHHGSSPENSTAPARLERDDYLGDWVWLPRFPNPLRRPLAAASWIVQLVFGFVTLLTVLTISAAVPGLNFFALGYLLEAEGHVARSGKPWHTWPLIPAMLRIGSIVIGMLLWLVPIKLLADYVADARFITPDGTASRFGMAALILSSVTVAIHLMLALARGGSLGCFVRPIKNARWLHRQVRSGDYLELANHHGSGFLAAVKPWHHFWLGIRGFIGAWAWLALPTALFDSRVVAEGTWYRLLSLVGGVCLVPVLAMVPFLQVRLAAENRFAAMFEIRAVRELFRRAPLSWLVAAVALYALSIPLFLYSLQFRMHAPFRLGIWWDLTLISIFCTLAPRGLLGWAYYRSTMRGPAWIGLIWFGRLSLAGCLAIYVWLLFQTPMTHEFSPWQLEHHALVLPIPWPW